MASELQVGFDSQLGGLEPEIVEPGRGRACERLAFEPGERRSAPEREGLAEHGCCLSRVSRLERGATPLEKVLEPVEVDLSALYAEGITVGASLEHPLPEFPPEARDV